MKGSGADYFPTAHGLGEQEASLRGGGGVGPQAGRGVGGVLSPRGLDTLAEDWLGAVLGGRYRLERFLGRGGMGVVFACLDQMTGKRYALKMIQPHLAAHPSFRAGLLHELRVLEGLSHPGIVRTFEVHDDENSGILFLTMQLLEGETLAVRLDEIREGKRRPFGVRSGVSLLCALAEVLAYAHGQGVIHRDLKPENIMLCEDDTPRLMDFGIAKLLSTGRTTFHTGFVGTAYYMAPEQLRGDAVVTPAADVFSLGVLSYVLLTGEFPMGRFVPVHQLLTQEQKQDLPEEACEALDAVISQALESRSTQRLQSASGFAQALQEALRVTSPPEASRAGQGEPPGLAGSGDADLERIAGGGGVGGIADPVGRDEGAGRSAGGEDAGFGGRFGAGEAQPGEGAQGRQRGQGRGGEAGQEEIPEFLLWYSRTFGRYHWPVQALLWLLYGFLWIPGMYWLTKAQEAGALGRFRAWYLPRLGRVHPVGQVLLWLFYGFLWIPVAYWLERTFAPSPTRFTMWHAVRLGRLPLLLRIVLWLFYGFVWIPLWYGVDRLLMQASTPWRRRYLGKCKAWEERS